MSLERIRQYFIVARREINSGEPLKVGRGLTKIFLAVVLVLAVSPQNTELGGWQFRLVAFFFSIKRNRRYICWLSGRIGLFVDYRYCLVAESGS